MGKEIRLRIEACYGDLRPSEKRAADYILENLGELKVLSLDQLAKQAGVSQPTVMRTIKALGYSGYKEFRYAVVEKMARQEYGDGGELRAMYGYSLTGKEKLEEIPKKIVAKTGQMTEEMLKNISPKIFRQVTETLSRAHRIDIYSVENSNVTAQDLLTKLLYLGMDCRHYADSYLQRICAGTLSPGDVAIGISYSGNSRDTVDAVRAARKAGAVTIVITNFRDSLITHYADLLLCTSQDQVFYGDAIFSRTTQIMIVDMIYMGLLASDYERYVKVLNTNSRVVQERAYLTWQEEKSAKHSN